MPSERLGNLCEINPSLPPDGKSAEACSFVPMEAVDEAFGTISKHYFRKVAEVKKGYTPFQNGDVLFAKITPCMENGKAAIARRLSNGVGYGSTEFHVIRPKGQVLAEWVFHFLRQKRIRNVAERNMTGSAGQKRVPAGFLENIEIPLPPLSEQKRIAALLEKADRVRRLRRYARQMSEGFLQSVFREMFGDLSSADCNFSRLGDEADIASGVTIGQRYKTNDLISVPYLRVANVKDGYLDLSEIKSVSVPKQEADSLYLKPRDILMTEGGDFDKLGRGCMWKGEIADCIHQNHVFRVRFTTEAVSPELFSVYLRSPRAKSYFLSCAKQTTNLASINMTQLRDAPVPILPIKQQAAFLKIRQDYLRLERQNAEAERQSEHLFQTLLHQAFAET